MGFWLLATIFAVSAGVSYVATRQAQKQARKASDAMRGVLLNKESNVEPIPVIYGTRRVGGTRVFISTRDETGGDPNEYLYIAHVLCEGEINAVSQIKFDDILITDARFSGLVTHNVHLGTDDQTYDSLLTEANAGWTSAHRLRGVAYIAFRIKWDQDVFSNIPDITCVVQGRKVFDPRNSTTAYSNNPALCIRDYLTNARYGKGLTSAQIDDTAFSQAATDCDEVVTFYTTGTTGKLFECNAVVQTDATLFSNIEMMLNGCRGFLPYNQGVYSLRIDKAASSVFAFDQDNIVGGIGIKGESKEDKYNRVIIKFPNYELDYEPDDAIWPDADSTEETTYLAEDGGTLLVGNFDNDTITNYYSARDLARIILLRSRNAIRVQFKTTSEALQLSVGDVVTVTHDTPAWSAKPFQLEELTMNYDGGCSVSMVEYQSGIYPYDTAIEERDYPATNLPDPFTVLPPTSLVATGSVVTNADGSVTSGIDVSWTASTDSFVTGYEITWTASGGDSETTTVVSPEYYIFNLNSGQTYTISVRSINTIGARSTALTTTGISPAVDTTAPRVPTSPSVSGTFQQIDLAWTNPTDSDFSYVEIKRANTATEGDAVVIGTTSGTSFIDGPYTVVLTRYYWLRSVDRTGNASAWVSAGNGTTIQLGAGDFAAGIIDYNFLNVPLQTTIAGKVDTTTFDLEVADLQLDIDVKADQTSVTTIINETQDIGNTVDLVATRMLTLATTQSEQLGIVRDAGITVDPSTGAVTIQAVETLSSQTDTRFSAVEVDLDAAEAAINLKASVTYVNNAIAAAVLDSADLASLDALELKVNQAEIDIDANEAAILLKADSTTVSGINTRVNQAEIDISGNTSAIALKASQTDLTALDDRVSVAEVEIDALDAASITLTVRDTITLKDQLDKDNIRSLKDLLAAYNQRESLRTDLAYAQSSITADVTELRVSTTTARTELLALIDSNQALILSEQVARADADSALSSSIVSLTATVGTNTGNITTEQSVRADADTVLGGRIDSLTLTVGQNTGAITTEAAARTSADSVLTNTGETLRARFGVSKADTYSAATTYLANDEVVYTGLLYKATQETTGNLPTNSNYWVVVETVSAAISAEVATEASARTAADEALSVTSQTLLARFGVSDQDTYNAATAYTTNDEVVYLGILYRAKGPTTGNLPTNATYWELIETVDQDLAVNAALVSTEAQTRANADSALSATSQTLLARFGVSNQDTYNAATAYVVNDEVVYLGILYKSKGSTTGNLPTNTTYWELIETVDQDLATNAGLVSTEAVARANADSALGQLITTLSASVATNSENIGTNSEDILTNTSDIVDEAEVRASADEALSFTSQTLLARFGVSNQDTYSATTAYVINDEVVYLGVLYKAKSSTTGNLPTNTTYWEVIETVDQDLATTAALVSTEAQTRATADTALGALITTLTASVATSDANIATNVSAISDEATARATADSALAQTNRTLFAGLNLPPGSDLYSATQTYAVGEGTVYDGTPYICIQASLNNLPTDTDYWTEITTTSGAIQENNESRIGYCLVDGSVTDAKDSAACTAASGTWVSDTAIVTAAKQIKIKQPDGTTATIETAAQAYVDQFGDIEATYGVRINNDGHVAGFSLISTAIAGGTTSAFVVQADQFAIGGTGELEDTYPFVVYTTDTDVTVDGITHTIPAGAYMQSANIDYLSAKQIVTGKLEANFIEIDGATIASETVDGVNRIKIKDLGVDTAQIKSLAVNTLQIGDDAVSQIRTNTSTSDVQLVSGTWTQLASLTFTPAAVLQNDGVTSNAQPISIKGFGSFIFIDATNAIQYGSLQFRLTQGYVLKTINVGQFSSSGFAVYGGFVGTATPIFVDTNVLVTSRTYKLEALYTAQAGGSTTCRIEAGAVLECVEVKR